MELAEKVNNFLLLANRQNKNKELQKFLDALPFYTMLVDEDHNIVYANKSISGNFDIDPLDFSEGYRKSIHGKKTFSGRDSLEERKVKAMPVQREVFDEERGRWLSYCIYPTDLETQSGKNIYFHMIEDITPRKKSEEDLRHTISKFTKMTEASISAISKLVESRDPYTALHQAKVGSIAYMISKELGLSDKMADSIQVAGLLHDVGKTAVPIEILYKPGKLSKYEFEDIKNHSLVGYEILKGIEFDIPIAEIALQHHERLDGSGYPYGLKEDQIFMETKIISVADVLDAMTSHRPYRPKRSLEEAISEIDGNAGVLYDKKIAKVAVKLCRMGEIQPDSLGFVE